MEGTTTMTTAVSNIFTVAGDALDMVTGNEILLTFFVAGIVFVGVAVVRKLKR